MRIGCLQFAPQVGDVSNNITRAERVLSRADPDTLQSLDLLVLPEMAFSGYNFKSQEHIAPHVEPTASGTSSRWARSTARKYGCAVAVGYPETAEPRDPAAAPELYNALLMVDGSGERLAHYRKSFLYYTDSTWAREGQGFFGGKMPQLGQVAIGICMDINPYKFEAPWDAYEFAVHVLRVRANLVILSTAWLTHDERTGFLAHPEEPDMATLAYWVWRLEPVIRAGSSEEIIVVIANRSGIEDDATYVGTSTVLGIKNGEVSVYGILGRGTEQLLMVDTDQPPLGKLVQKVRSPLQGEPRAPPAPADSAPDEPPRDAGPGSGSGLGSVDSPTLPSGFAPSARTRPQQTHSVPNTPTRTPTDPHLTAQKRRATHPRPKLSLQTNLTPAVAPATPSPAIQPATTMAPSNRAPTTTLSPDDAPTTTRSTPLAEIPIFVDVYYSPSDSEPRSSWDWRRRRLDDTQESQSQIQDLGQGLSLTIDALSPWSVSSCRSGASSACGSPRKCRMAIPIAASPSIFVGGGGGGGGSGALWQSSAAAGGVCF